jgi:predicted AlkP superfamily phosphohydrolase/phosphomutase
MTKTLRILFIILVFFLLGHYAYKNFIQNNQPSDKKLKLYWFIPDGFRADPELFNIFEWAKNGELPNIAKLMESGSYGFSIPDYPSHTPVNFASLMTGSHPKTHGVADGPMHIENYPLNITPLSGFKSNAKKVAPAWLMFEDFGLDVFLMSMPGSTPPELSRGTTVRGRWGGWGADFYAVNFQDETDNLSEAFFSKSMRLFLNGPELTQKLSSNKNENNFLNIKSFSEIKELKLEAWDSLIYGYIYDSTDDKIENYDRIAFSKDQKNLLVDLKDKEWSEWLPITLKWRTKDDKNIYTPKKSEFETMMSAIDVETKFKIKIIKLDSAGKFRLRFIYDNLNEYLTVPSTVAKNLSDNVGPMVDFVDNYPPQLIYFPEDKETFLQEAEFSLDWHKKSVAQVINNYSPEVIIHNIYTPNQMLTSRWWLGFIDPKSSRYNDVDEVEREKLWQEVKWMYKKIDDQIGEIMKNADENSYIVFSSDHGVATLNKSVYLNNFFAKKGLLTIKYDEKNQLYDIDWDKTKVAFLSMDNIYISPTGLGGNWTRSSGVEYEELRNQVIELIKDLKDDEGKNILKDVVRWEDAEKFFDLPTNRVGDLVISNEIGFGWSEEVNKNQDILKTPLTSGYKQAVNPKEKSVWTPFIISGPGVKKNYQISKPISHIEQLPTILKLMKINKPEYVEGVEVDEVFEK